MSVLVSGITAALLFKVISDNYSTEKYYLFRVNLSISILQAKYLMGSYFASVGCYLINFHEYYFSLLALVYGYF